jgi:L-arabinonolactonase
VNLLEVIAVEDELGESPLWDERLGLLYWIDIYGERLGALDVATGDWTVWPTRQRFGSIALTTVPGRLLAGTAAGLEIVQVDKSGVNRLNLLAAPELHIPGNRFNDGKTDRQGRFWAGTMEDAETGLRTGAMYRLDLDGRLTREWSNVGVPNGMCFSPDGTTMYTADSLDGALWAAEYDPTTGEPGPRRVLAACSSPGGPDGSTVDSAGGIWNAEWGNSRVTRYRPDGSVDRVLDLRATNPTCPAFAGPGFDLLFITTARVGLDPGEHGGSILVYEAGTTGVAEAPFPLR